MRMEHKSEAWLAVGLGACGGTGVTGQCAGGPCAVGPCAGGQCAGGQ